MIHHDDEGVAARTAWFVAAAVCVAELLTWWPDQGAEDRQEATLGYNFKGPLFLLYFCHLEPTLRVHNLPNHTNGWEPTLQTHETVGNILYLNHNPFPLRELWPPQETRGKRLPVTKSSHHFGCDGTMKHV